MKLSYFSDTDTLYIDLAEQPSRPRQPVFFGVAVSPDQNRIAPALFL